MRLFGELKGINYSLIIIGAHSETAPDINLCKKTIYLRSKLETWLARLFLNALAQQEYTRSLRDSLGLVVDNDNGRNRYELISKSVVRLWYEKCLFRPIRTGNTTDAPL